MTMSFQEELDLMVEHAIKAVQEAGQEPDEDELRKMISAQLAKARGEEAPEAPKTPEAPKGPVVDVNAGSKLSLDKAAAMPTEPVKRGRGRPRKDAPPPEVVAVTPYWYESEEDREFWSWFIPGKRAGYVEGNAIITGPSGQGKTMGVIEVCREMNVDLNIIDCASITTIEKWVGHKEIDDKGTRFVKSEFLEMVEAKNYPPSVILLDEISRLHPTFHNLTFPLLDGRRNIFVPELHDWVQVHQQVVIIATANIGGRYTGTYNLDAALRERFGYTIERGFPPEADEVKILMTRCSIKLPEAKLMVDIAGKSRIKWENGDLSAPISTRTLVHAAKLVASGASVARAFELTAIPHYPKDGGTGSERTIVKGLIEGKGGSK